MDLDLKDKIVLIQGASSGLGYFTAKAFSDSGAIIAMASSNEEKLKSASESIPNSHYFVTDFNKPEAAKKLILQVVDNLGHIDILVTNTANPASGCFESISSEQWLQNFQSVFLSASESIQAVLPAMKDKGFGRIIMLTTHAAKQPDPNMIVSSSLRSGLLALMKAVSQTSAKWGITINSILPGFIKTGMLLDKIENAEAIFSPLIPSGNLGDPKDVADLAVFLASNSAKYITGQAIGCDGGLSKGI